MVKKRWRNIEVEREDELNTTLLLIGLHEKLDIIIELLKEKKGGSE